MSAATDTHPLATRLRHLPTPLAVSGGLLLLAAAIGGFLAGAPGAIGGAAGVGVVAVGYAFSSVAVAWADSVAPSLVMTVGLTTYVFKFTLLGVVFFAVPGDWPGLRTMAVAMIVSILTWVGAQIWWTLRAEVPTVTYHLPPAGDHPIA
ncbi:hypothetical protein [Actinoplanes auranticolor]|uniref:hypothetical protein n=1 Tax=Actinoplanes auranticolor TaxID=47988 RepID=UPI001BB40F57|nr:hypothetical protein [Actinoplanes auranticolor]